MQLKYNTYTQLSDRVNAAQAKVQERTPDFVVLQPSLVPYKADSPRKILVLSITIVALVLSLETCILRYVNEKNAQPHPMYYWIV